MAHKEIIELRAIRKTKEKDGFYHIHMVEEHYEDFIDKHTIAFSKVCQNIAQGIINNSSSMKLFKWFDECTASAHLPKHEHIRLRIKATLMIYFVIGTLAFFTAMAALVYYTRSFPLMTENGLKGVLIIMIVQGLSLIFLSLLGLHVYRNGQIPRVHLLYFNSVLFLLIAILISINWTVPESSVMIFQSKLALTAGHGAPHFAENWCCDMNGYKEKCTPVEEPQPTVPSSDFKNNTNTALREFFDLECSRLMGWSLTEKMIKSMSYFLIPALLTITLTNSLVHFASSKRRLNPVCIKNYKL